MFNVVKNLMKSFFSRSSYDFFEPEASENLICSINLDPAMDHLVANCNEGIGRVKVIHEMAQKIIKSDIRPFWLRADASVDLTKLRQVMKITDAVAAKLLTSKGFVKISDLHIFDRESLNKWSHAARKESRWNPCPKGNDEVKHRIRQVTFSPALALCIKMRTLFDPKACKSVFEETSNVVNLRKEYALSTPKPRVLRQIQEMQLRRFDKWFWSRTLAAMAISFLTIGFLYYSGYLQGNFMKSP